VCVVKSTGGRTVGELAVEQLEAEEPGVPLVEVVDPRGPADGGHGSRPADTQHELLFETVSTIAAVETVGDRAIGGIVPRQVGVEEQQRHPADGHPPHRGGHHPVTDRHLDHHAGVDATEILGLVGLVALRLRAAGQPLSEESLSVEQPHRAERHPEIAGRLQVVARQDPESTRVLGHELADAELR
jgi:hypothetical protein